MSRRIRFYEETLQDLDEISAYIGTENPAASVHFLEAAQAAFERIADAPGMGTRRDYGNPALVGLRVFRIPEFGKYGIYYLTTAETIEILHVLHGSRDLDAIFAPSEE